MITTAAAAGLLGFGEMLQRAHNIILLLPNMEVIIQRDQCAHNIVQPHTELDQSYTSNVNSVTTSIALQVSYMLAKVH